MSKQIQYKNLKVIISFLKREKMYVPFILCCHKYSSTYYTNVFFKALANKDIRNVVLSCPFIWSSAKGINNCNTWMELNDNFNAYLKETSIHEQI